MKLLFNRARIIFLMILAISYSGCEEDDEGNALPEVLAGFTQLISEDSGTVSFINTSENAENYEWDFGDGTTSTEIDPIKTFVTGTYTVSLTASNVAGGTDTFEDELVIVVPEPVTLPITFDGANVDYDASTFNGAAFEIVDNPAPGGSNDTASKVGAITNSGAQFEGFFFDLGTAIDLTTDKTIQMNFWADAAVDILLKLEEGTGAATEITASHGGTGWEMLSFDFTSSDSFSRLTMFVDGPGTTAGTFYIDDIEQVETMTGGGSSPTTSAPAPPARDAADVISIYGGTYTNIAGINYNPDWGQSGLAFVNTDFDPGDGNLALAYPTFNFQGTDFSGNAQDASTMEFLHVDIWVPTGTDRQVKISPINGSGGTGAGEFLVEVPLTPGAWNSVDLPIGDFTGMTWDDVVQLKFDGQFNGDGSANTDPHDIYLDNIYFYKEASGGGSAPTTSAPAPPARDAGDVISIYGGVYTNVTGIDYDPNWGQSGFGLVNTAFDPGDGNLALAYPTFNYQGTDFSGNAQDASAMEFLHVDIWVPTGTDRQVKISPINSGTGAGEVLVVVPVTPGSWNSVDLPIGDFTGMTWDSVIQMKFDGQFNGDGSANTDPHDIYLDNIYFYKEASGGGSAPTTSAPAPPARDAGDVISIYGGVYTNVTGIDYDPNWGQSGFGLVNTTFDPGDGNLALAYPTFNYQGTDFSGNAQDASTMEFLHVDIWVPTGTDRQVKISPINSGTGAGEVLIVVPVTPGSWNSVDLPIGDFTGMTWDSVIQMKFDGQFNGDGSANTDPYDIYLDNIYFYKEASGGGSAPTTSAPAPPARDAGDVISIYGGVYTNVTGIDYDPNWGQSGFGLVNTTFDPGDGNLALAYPTFNYQGTDFSGNAQDASAMEFLHVDIWVPTGTDRQVKISPINSGTGAGEVLVVVPVTPGSWNSVDLPIGDFTGMTWDSVIQMKFDGQFNGDGSANTDPHDIYLDNIYFYKEASGGGSAPTTSAPAPPARDAGDVISIYGGVYTNVTGIDYDPNWGQSGFGLVNTAFDPGDGNLALAYPTFNYQGTDFSGNAQDASAMEFLHVDIWVPTGTDRQVKISPINSGTGAGEVLVVVPVTPGSWNSVDLPIGDFTGMTWDSVIQMKFDGQFNGDGSANTDPYDLYLDNIYFYKTAGGGGGGCPAPPTGELLPNGGFEANSGDASCWQLNDGGGAVTVIGTDANTGTYSARLVTGPSQVPNLKQERFATSIAGNQGVQVTFRYKINTAFVDGAILQVLAFSEFTTNPAVAHDLGNATDVSTTGVWQTYTGTFTTDASIEEGISLLIQATCGGAGTCAGEVLIDDVVVTEI